MKSKIKKKIKKGVSLNEKKVFRLIRYFASFLHFVLGRVCFLELDRAPLGWQLMDFQEIKKKRKEISI